MVEHRNLQSNMRESIDLSTVPRHVAVVMDGNGRWAKNRALPRKAGHTAGAKAAEKFVTSCFKYGIQYVTLFAFSSENWQRPANEVQDLMALFRYYLNNDIQNFIKQEIRIHFIGEFSRLDADIIALMEDATRTTAHYTKHLTIAMSYGGRLDICNAVQKIAADYKEGVIDLSQINDELMNNYLMTAELPEPDLFIRTSGEYRISNFMLWQMAYTELYFSDKLWPDFSEADLQKALYEYQRRERRYGK